MFGSDEGIILISSVSEVLGFTLGLDGGKDMEYSDGSLMVSMMSNLRVHCLSTHLDHTMELNWVLLMELKMRAQHWEYHLDILRVRCLDMNKAWYLELVKFLAIYL